MATQRSFRWWQVVLALMLVGGVINIFAAPTTPQAVPTSSAPAVAAPRPAPVDTAQQRRLRERLTVLKRSFDFNEDAVRGGGWYTHRRFYSGGPRSMLWVAVDHAGRFYMLSAFRGDTWIFHEQVVVRIGDRVLETPSLSRLSPNNRTEVVSGGVKEELHFVNGDGGVLGAIAADSTSRIVVRQEGREKYDDFTLSDNDRRAIRESVELGRLIKRLGASRER